MRGHYQENVDMSNEKEAKVGPKVKGFREGKTVPKRKSLMGERKEETVPKSTQIHK